MKSQRRIHPCGVALGLVCVLLARSVAIAEAPVDVSKAADAFSRAQQAELRGDWKEAANLYALADEVAPTPEALRSAARAALKAGMNARAATHAATLLSRESEDAESRAVGAEVLRATEGELTRIEAHCTVGCRVLIDGQLASPRIAISHVLYARPGTRQLSASFEDGPAAPEQSLELQAGQTVRPEFAPPVAEPLASAPPPPTSEPSAEKRGLSPWVFGSGVIATGVLGAATVWSSMKVKSAHDDYDPAAADARSQYDYGQKLELRTNVLLGVTGAVAAGTVVTAFFTDWGRRSEDAPTAQVRAVRPQLAISREAFFVGVSAPWFR